MKKLKIEKGLLLICLIICLFVLNCLIVIIISGLKVNALEKDVVQLKYENSRQSAQLKDRAEEIEILNLILEQEPEKEVYAGEYEITYYCPCVECCGKTDGITSSGTIAHDGITVAADWDILPPGTEIYIDGIGFRTVEDKSGLIKGNRLDVFLNSHTAALEAGRHMADVWIIEK